MARRRNRSRQLGKVMKWFADVFRASFRLFPAGIMAGVLCYLFFGVKQMLYADPYFLVERVTLYPSGILNEAEYDFLHDKTRGRSLMNINLKRISSDLERNPRIKRAEVTRSFPNELKIFLSERVPYVQIQLRPMGSYYLVSRDRMVLAQVDTPSPAIDIVEDWSSRKKQYSIGTIYENRYFDRLDRVFEFVRDEPFLSGERVSKLSVDRISNYTLILHDGIELRIGKPAPISPEKRALAKSLLSAADRNALVYLDLRYKDVIAKRKS